MARYAAERLDPVDLLRDFNRISTFIHCGPLAAQVIKEADALGKSCQAEELLPNLDGHRKIAISQMSPLYLTLTTFTSAEPHNRRHR